MLGAVTRGVAMSVREQIDALGQAIDELRVEAQRLESSAQSRASLITLERAAIARLRVAPLEEVVAEQTPGPLAQPLAAPAAATEVSTEPEPEPEPSPEPAAQEDAGPIRSDDPRNEETSPLTEATENVEEAFEKFFSAEVEPEPARRWLLDH